MVIRTTEKKIIEAGWEFDSEAGGFFIKNINGILICLSCKVSSYNEAHNYDMFYGCFGAPHSPDDLIAIGTELKKLEVK